ncbi:uncharacterized protein LOC121734865 [Aricia agestis]|uniref:uncharacterized protein LOC121734865 n=1 Tax=Aricia agestis TaxID=91739 RepID=UPI001C2094B0|nr:uncharacterized protein LOC121734865 [Aricia agestis]
MHCAKCKEIVTDFVHCGKCGGHYHFTCAGISESSYRKLGQEKKSAWRCIPCRAQVQSSDPANTVSLADILLEIKNLRTDFNTMKTDLNDIKSDISSTKQCMLDLNMKWSDMQQRFDDIEGRLNGFEDKVSCITTLQKDLKKANEIISALEQNNNTQDQFSRLNNIEISGIPMRNGENLYSMLHDLCSVVGFSLCETDIDTVHRVRRHITTDKQALRHPAIIVRFTQRRRKDQLLAAARARRTLSSAELGLQGPACAVYISDHLTPTNKLLLKRARELKVEKQYAYLWVRDCKILLRKNDKSNVIRISSESDLLKIK